MAGLKINLCLAALESRHTFYRQTVYFFSGETTSTTHKHTHTYTLTHTHTHSHTLTHTLTAIGHLQRAPPIPVPGWLFHVPHLLIDPWI